MFYSFKSFQDVVKNPDYLKRLSKLYNTSHNRMIQNLVRPQGDRIGSVRMYSHLTLLYAQVFCEAMVSSSYTSPEHNAFIFMYSMWAIAGIVYEEGIFNCDVHKFISRRLGFNQKRKNIDLIT